MKETGEEPFVVCEIFKSKECTTIETRCFKMKTLIRETLLFLIS